ncbi:hypothetical protein J5J86_19280 [Aquabacter sp. L1I39]|uniref:hypothetical protein n=1 Tax=Aquabacter sp. L1I39 TaxID=2820278 RepID=UPI001ADB9764|nr:hypothetical protein [Aquabacter sp. L1I39]QTL02887.1 hypothetical protein J5J86_19280 [Aquabacter sp. L1I39]
MQRDNEPSGAASAEAAQDATPLSDAAAEAAAGGMIVNQNAFLKWAQTHDRHGNEIDPSTGQIVKAPER